MYEQVSCCFGLFILVRVIKDENRKDGTIMSNTYVFPAILKSAGGKKEIFLPQFSKTIEVMPEDTVEKTLEAVKTFLATKFTNLTERKELIESINTSSLSLSEGESLLFVEVNKPKRFYGMAERARHLRQISGC